MMTLCHRIIHQSFRLMTKPIMIRKLRFHDHAPVGLSYIQTLRGYLVMGIPYMVVSLFVHLYVFVTSCAQYKHEAQFLVVHSWSQHPENPTQTRHGLLPFTTATRFMKP